jgi:exopolysaccharide biosynthesis polyprenyl glycosylphosphotransferase
MGNPYPRITPPTRPNSVQIAARRLFDKGQAGSTSQVLTLGEDLFKALLTIERRRAERSHKPFVLMLLHANLENGAGEQILKQAAEVVTAYKRESDLLGWYQEHATLGVIFTEVSLSGEHSVTEALQAKIKSALLNQIGRKKAAKITISLHVFPESWNGDHSGLMADSKLYPDINRSSGRVRLSLAIKRAMDLAGSACLLVLLSPLYAAIALAVKLTSEGPAIFEQERLGQFGERFKCLKFRTMYTDNSPKIHQDYIRQFITGSKEKYTGQNQVDQPVFKIADDPRVTPIGRWLRKTSLDEIPQFWNVLRGEMSLVGPRPPLPYEFEIYDIWHRRRVLEVKPGITGLWQISGRSRTRFDDMVRLDLRYCQTWSLWLDLKILFATPRAVLTGDGAY